MAARFATMSLSYGLFKRRISYMTGMCKRSGNMLPQGPLPETRRTETRMSRR